MLRNMIFALLAFATTFQACNKKRVEPVIPEELSIALSTTTVSIGRTLTATVLYKNSMGAVATPGQIDWSSSNNAIATISSGGVITGLSVGQVIITAKVGATVSATKTVEVTPAIVPERLEVSPTAPAVTVGTSATFTLKYFNNVGQETAVPAGVVWTSSNTAAATVTQAGVATGVAAGTTTIRATLNAISASATLTVSNAPVPERLEIAPLNPSVTAGSTQQFTVKYFNNMGQEVPVPVGLTWSSSATNIATINGSGLATSIAAGSSTIRATLNALQASTTLTVNAPLTLANIVLTPNTLLELRVTAGSPVTAVGTSSNGTVLSGITFNWSSASTAVATVAANGVVSGMGYGSTTVTASANGITSAPLNVDVIRWANFSGSGSAGTGKLKLESNGNLRLSTSSNFVSSSAAPDLYMYLSNSNTNISSAVEVAKLTTRSGAQTWIVPGTPTMTQYRYALIWCKAVGVAYGSADLQ